MTEKVCNINEWMKVWNTSDTHTNKKQFTKIVLETCSRLFPLSSGSHRRIIERLKTDGHAHTHSIICIFTHSLTHSLTHWLIGWVRNALHILEMKLNWIVVIVWKKDERKSIKETKKERERWWMMMKTMNDADADENRNNTFARCIWTFKLYKEKKEAKHMDS